MSEWISIKDRLPGSGGKYIAFVDNPPMKLKTICTAFFDRGYARWFNDNCSATLRSVTHWMPLPPPPETKA